MSAQPQGLCSGVAQRRSAHRLPGSQSRLLHARRAAARPAAGRLASYAASAVAGEERALSSPLSPSRTLKEPVLLSALARSRASVTDCGGDGALDKYMTLPVEQYFVLEPESVTRLGPNAFRCRIPRLSFFNVWLEPTVDVDVLISPTSVHMRSRATRIDGSEFVQQSKLNEHFDMFWSTTLTWQGGLDECHIAVETEVKVWCEVLPPFHRVPRSLLSGACNAVLRRAVPALLNVFIRQLASDYRKWGAEPAYRARRAGLADAAADADDAEE